MTAEVGLTLRGSGPDAISRIVQVHYVTEEWVGYAIGPEFGGPCALRRMRRAEFESEADSAEVLNHEDA